jgi:heat shock protein HtpX
MIKRVLLFVTVNILVVVTLSIVMQLLGVAPYLTAYGIDYMSLAVFCAVWGMGGAFISLGLSRIMAKWMMGVKVIDPGTARGDLADLVQTVHRLSRDAGIETMPEVGVYESPEVNAFATGPTRNRALVAVSTGLLNRMSREQVAGVLGHEIAHIVNGDMVTMTLIQGIVNAVVMFSARVVAYAISLKVREESRRMVHFITVIVLEIALSILGAVVVAWFSRQREFRADAGGARLAGKPSMIGALRALQRNAEIAVVEDQPSLATLKISGKPGGFLALIATHPPLEERIAALERMR